jgi:hypothetical protein
LLVAFGAPVEFFVAELLAAPVLVDPVLVPVWTPALSWAVVAILPAAGEPGATVSATLSATLFATLFATLGSTASRTGVTTTTKDWAEDAACTMSPGVPPPLSEARLSMSGSATEHPSFTAPASRPIIG